MLLLTSICSIGMKHKNGRKAAEAMFCSVAWWLQIRRDPRTENYGPATIPLFLFHLWQMKMLHMRVLVGRSYSGVAELVWRSAGAEVMTSTTLGEAPMTIWYFDGKVAPKNIASGLSVVYHTIWAAKGSSGALKLTPKEREIARILMQSGTPIAEKWIASQLGKSEGTVKKQLQHIYDKAKDLKIEVTHLHELVKYLHDHPEEYALTPVEIGL